MHSVDESNKYFVVSAVTSKSIILLMSFIFIYGVYVISQQIHIISIDQQLMCPISFHFHLVFLDHPIVIFQGKAVEQ
jgi:hypothetical protein